MVRVFCFSRVGGGPSFRLGRNNRLLRRTVYVSIDVRSMFERSKTDAEISIRRRLITIFERFKTYGRERVCIRARRSRVVSCRRRRTDFPAAEYYLFIPIFTNTAVWWSTTTTDRSSEFTSRTRLLGALIRARARAKPPYVSTALIGEYIQRRYE